MIDYASITALTVLCYNVTIVTPDPVNADVEIEMVSNHVTSYVELQVELRADFDLPSNRPLEVVRGKFGKPGSARGVMWGPGVNVSIVADL